MEKDGLELEITELRLGLPGRDVTEKMMKKRGFTEMIMTSSGSNSEQCESGVVSSGVALKDGDNCEYVTIYEDKDGDWMLAGDVPWGMFIESCRRLRIMKRSEATGFGLQPRGVNE
ncbi:hypothetical protein DY000_02042949 [Brassica cretica]|uniref:Auxin-responsive protein n=1 Tax=Brassica cretica TaxID=69181 RepID=A0ABQ7BFN1_BRACR|nr:hypothetical protein DY000_02042949 [Brassica cretica]